MITLFRSDKEVTLNPYSSIYFIKSRILGILCILELSIVYALNRLFLLLIYICHFDLCVQI